MTHETPEAPPVQVLQLNCSGDRHHSAPLLCKSPATDMKSAVVLQTLEPATSSKSVPKPLSSKAQQPSSCSTDLAVDALVGLSAKLLI